MYCLAELTKLNIVYCRDMVMTGFVAHAQIVELLNIVYCLAELTEFAAFIHLHTSCTAMT